MDLGIWMAHWSLKRLNLKFKRILLTIPPRSLLHVDADARMESFTDSEGNKRSNLSLIARKLLLSQLYPGPILMSTGNFDVISRPRIEEHTESNDEGIVQEGQ